MLINTAYITLRRPREREWVKSKDVQVVLDVVLLDRCSPVAGAGALCSFIVEHEIGNTAVTGQSLELHHTRWSIF